MGQHRQDATAAPRQARSKRAARSGGAATADQAKPLDQSKLLDQTEPHDQSKPVDQSKPLDQPNQLDQPSPSNQPDPLDQANPSHPTDPTNPTNPTDPTNPSNPTDQLDDQPDRAVAGPGGAGHTIPEQAHAIPEQAHAIPEQAHAIPEQATSGHAIPEQAHSGPEQPPPGAGPEQPSTGGGALPERVRRAEVAPVGVPTQHRARRAQVDLPALPVRARLAVSAGLMTVGACRALRRGWSSRAGGRVALRLDPRLASRLAAGRTIALVSGTNGKSTTTRMVTQALRGLGPVAATRTSAGNEQAVVSALTRDRGAGRAVLEIDELALPTLARILRPAVIVLLNLSREYQPERGLATVLAGWRELFDTLDWPCTVLANVDDPLVAWAAANAPRLVGVSGGLLWPQDALLCPDCGVRLRWSGPHWWCELCGVRRPQPAWQVTDDDMIVGPEVTTPLRVAIAGRAAPADALFAVAAAHTVGSPVRDAGRAVARVAEVDGRYAAYPFEAHIIHLHLADNSAAWREIIDVAGHSDMPVVFAMEPDGVADATVLWDAPGELLHGVAVTVAGARRYDVAAWLEVCGVEVAGVADDPLAVVSELPAGEVLVAGNHPAFTALRARLRSRT